MGFTKSEVINRDWDRLKGKYGRKFASRYFDIVDKLRNPNYFNIVEYRYAGVVTEDCGCYHFHAVAGFEYKTNYIAFVLDVTEQFNQPPRQLG